jgi:hypothetical protein
LVGLLDPENTASRVWADTASRTKRNLEALERRGLSERIEFRKRTSQHEDPHRLSKAGASAVSAAARRRLGDDPARWPCSGR